MFLKSDDKKNTNTNNNNFRANGAVISASKRSSKKNQVAIKRCYIEDHDTHHHTYILRELRIMGCMSHPNLIQLTESCMWGDYLWMAMELMTCSVFGLLFNVTVGLPESYAVRIAQEVSDFFFVISFLFFSLSEDVKNA